MTRSETSAVQPMYRAIALIGAVLVLSVFSGCGTMPVSIRYSAIAATETLHRGSPSPRAFVTRFSDDRSDKDRIGRMKNLYGTTVKTLVTTDDFGMILAEATTDALRKAGLDTELHLDRVASESVPEQETEGFAYIIGGKLCEVDVVSIPGWDTLRINAKVVIEVYLSTGSHEERIGPIEGTAERREIARLTADSYTMALDTAMQNCMRNMIRHLRATGAIEASSN